MGTARETLTKYTSQAQFEAYFVEVLGLISVKSYGAVGDGVTDDSAAITLALAALSSAGGKSLFFPTGTYKVDNDTVTAASFDGLYIWGDNSEFDGISLAINQIGAAATSGIAVLTTEGDMLYRGPATEARLPKGTASQMLVMNQGETAPEWVDSPTLLAPTPGDLLYTNGAGEQTALPIGIEGQVLKVGSTDDIEWVDGVDTVLTTEGDIPYVDSSGNPERLPKGTQGQVLTMNSGETGPEWADSPNNILTTEGDLIYRDSSGDNVRLGIGTAGQVLSTNSTEDAPEWATVDDLLATKIWTGTLAEYTALGSKDANTLYFCT